VSRDRVSNVAASDSSGRGCRRESDRSQLWNQTRPLPSILVPRLEGLGGFEDLVGASANAKVTGEVDPADGAGGIDQELGGAGDVVALDAGAFVKQIVAADHFSIGIGEKGVRIAGFAAEILRLAGRIDADGDGPDAKLFEIRETLLNTP
jgi:hypothetical protein